MNLYKFSKPGIHPVVFVFLAFLSALLCSFCSFAMDIESPDFVAEVSTRLNCVAEKSANGRSELRYYDDTRWLYIDEWHVRKVSSYGSNNSVYADLSRLDCAVSFDGEQIQTKPNMYGLTYFESENVALPYGMQLISGSFDFSDSLYDFSYYDNDIQNYGCIISESFANVLSNQKGFEDLIGHTISLNNKQGRVLPLTVTGICKDSVLCNDYSEVDQFIFCNYAAYSRLSGEGTLVLKLNTKRYTTYEIMSIFFKNICRSPNSNTLKSNDDVLNSLISRFADITSNNNNSSTLIIFVFAFVLQFAVSALFFSLTARYVKTNWCYAINILFIFLHTLMSYFFLYLMEGTIINGVILSSLSYRSLGILIFSFCSSLVSWIIYRLVFARRSSENQISVDKIWI